MAAKAVSKSKQKTVIVYSAPWCPWCHKAKEYLDAHKIKYKDIDVNKDQKAAKELVEKSGQTGIPVLEIGGEIVIGFDRPKIAKLLGIKEE